MGVDLGFIVPIALAKRGEAFGVWKGSERLEPSKIDLDDDGLTFALMRSDSDWYVERGGLPGQRFPIRFLRGTVGAYNLRVVELFDGWVILR